MAARIALAVAGIGAIPGGIATASRNVAEALIAARGASNVEVLSLLDRDRPDWLAPDVTFLGFAGSRPRMALALAAAATRRRSLVFDHVTLAVPVLPFAWSGWTRIAVLAHGSESWRRIRRSSRWVFRSAAVVLANSRYTAARMREHGVAGRIEACPLGLPADAPLQPASPAPATLQLAAADGVARTLGPHAFLLAGRMLASEREKGHDELLDALPLVRARCADAQLVFAGPGDDRERLAARARQLGIADAVFLPGFVPRPQLEALHAAAYAYAMPSRQEGFGLSFLEAMNHAKACLGCRGDGAADVIVDGETGVLVDPAGGRDALAQALHGLLDDPARTGALGQAGRRRLHDQFTAEHYRQRVSAALEACLP